MKALPYSQIMNQLTTQIRRLQMNMKKSQIILLLKKFIHR